MNEYVTGGLIRRLREAKHMTQAELADALHVSDKAISKWETGRGYPDISLIEPLSAALGVSVIELFSGENVINQNRSCNMRRLQFYVCPLCGNVITSTGEAIVSCCGLTLPPLEAETPDDAHTLSVEPVEDEYFVTAAHEMSKTHFISFVAAIKDDGVELQKLYPEGPAEARVGIARTRDLYYYCNRHGLFKASVK